MGRQQLVGRTNDAYLDLKQYCRRYDKGHFNFSFGTVANDFQA